MSKTELGSREPERSNKFNPSTSDPFELANWGRKILDRETGPRALIVRVNGESHILSQNALNEVRSEHEANPDKVFPDILKGLQVFDSVVLIYPPISA